MHDRASWKLEDKKGNREMGEDMIKKIPCTYFINYTPVHTAEFASTDKSWHIMYRKHPMR